MDRRCSRPGCSRVVAGTLSFEYATSTIWLSPLDPERHPAVLELCEQHLDTFRPPRGWTVHDRRRVLTLVPPIAV